MDDDNFIDKQIQFMYGKYYEEILDGKEFIITNLSNSDSLVKDILDNNISSSILGYERFKHFAELLKKYWRKDSKNYVIKSDWYDRRNYDQFIITYNRIYNSKKQIIFPLTGYHLPYDKEIEIIDSIPFKEKNNKLFWRGSTTGVDIIKNNIRYNIVSKNINIHENIDIGFSGFTQTTYYNNVILFTPLYKPKKYKNEQIECKFILNIEGNDCSSSLPWVLSSNCCPLHNYPFSYETYLFGQGLEPYVHFVPINNDGSDLLEKYEWCLNNLDKCEEIALNGKKYMEKYLDKNLFNKIMTKFFDLYPLKFNEISDK